MPDGVIVCIEDRSMELPGYGEIHGRGERPKIRRGARPHKSEGVVWTETQRHTVNPSAVRAPAAV